MNEEQKTLQPRHFDKIKELNQNGMSYKDIVEHHFPDFVKLNGSPIREVDMSKFMIKMGYRIQKKCNRPNKSKKKVVTLERQKKADQPKPKDWTDRAHERAVLDELFENVFEILAMKLSAEKRVKLILALLGE